MKDNLIGKIVFNKLKGTLPIYYVVKDFDGQTLRIERIKKLDNIEAEQKHFNIVYCSKYEI